MFLMGLLWKMLFGFRFLIDHLLNGLDRLFAGCLYPEGEVVVVTPTAILWLRVVRVITGDVETKTSVLLLVERKIVVTDTE